jgi:hypothetical protein
MLFDFPCAFEGGTESDSTCPRIWGNEVMRLPLVCIALLAVAWPAFCFAQDAQPQSGRRTVVFDTTFDIAAVEPAKEQADEQDGADDEDGEGDEDWGIAAFQAQQRAALPSACATQSDILTSGASGRPRYDANGALIRAPAATCAPAPAAAQQVATVDDDRLIVDRESSGGCTEDRLLGTRTCRSSGSITIGNSVEGNERTRQAVDDMLDDLQRD